MRKIVLCLLLTATSFIAAAQNSVRNWEKSAGASDPTYSWFVTTGGNVNSCAYNPVTDKLYVANRQVGIYIIDPATGSITGTLNITGITLAGSLAFNKIRVTPTGEIFAASLRTSTANGNTFVYYWASEASIPVLLGNTTTGIALLSERAADAFAVTGSGQNVVMYFGGSGTSNLQVVNKNGTGTADFIKINNITLPAASSARSSIAPVTAGITSDVWISGATISKRLITSTGTVTKSLADNLLVAGAYTSLNSISNKFASLEYFEVGSKKFLAATGANDNPITGEGLAFHVYDVTDVNNVKLIEATKLSNTYLANATPGADIAIKKVLNGNGTYTVTFFQLVNHNGLASYTLNFAADGTLPVSLTSFTAGLSNGVSKLNWTTASESNNSGFDVQRSTDGVEFASIGFVASKAVQGNSSSVINYSYEDKTVPAGTHYYRLKQIDLNGDVEYSTIRVVNNVLNELAVKIYPNPAQNTLTLSTPLSLKGASYTVCNMVGQDFIKGKADELTRIDVSTLMPGIYFIKVISLQNEVQSIKFVKQ